MGSRPGGAGAAVVLYGTEFSPSRIGIISASAANSTPGSRRTRSSTSCHAARICAGLRSAPGEIANRAASILCTSRPGSSAASFNSVLPSIPAETSSTKASAISDITNALYKRREPAAVVRPPARSAASRLCKGTRSAGASPKSSALTSDTPIPKAKTRQSR